MDKAELQVTAKIDHVVWQKPNRGAIVEAALIDDDTPREDTVRVRIPHHVALDDFLQPGQWWRIEGNKERYLGDPQIGVTEATLLRPSGEHVKDLLAGDTHRFPGIGEAYADRLWDKLGAELHNLLNEGDEDELASVMRELKIPKPDDLAATLVSGWADLGYGEIITWLDGLPAKGQFGVWLGKKICRCFGRDARKRIEEDPYRLLAFYKEHRRYEWAAWKKVDEIAQRVFKVKEDDQRRLHGAVIEALYKAYDNRNTIVHRDVLLEKVKGRLGLESLAREALSRSYFQKTFVHDDEWFGARGAYLMEKEVAERMARIMRVKQLEMFNGEVSLDAKSIEVAIEEFEAQEGYCLGPDQREAVHLCINNRLAVITGGAGTGKTTVLKAVYHVIEKAGGEIKQMALAGRASRRMNEATNRPARTIAGFVCDTEAEYKDDTTFVVDESSMLDLPLTRRVLRQLPDGCRLILVGDAEQLPPIGPGLVFHLLVKELYGIVPTAVLKRVYRQTDKSGIPAVALAIRGDQENPPALPELQEYSGLGNGVSVFPASPDQMTAAIKKVYADLCETPEGKRNPEADVQILAIVNNGKAHGVDGINEALHAKYSQGLKRVLGYTEENAPWKAPAQFTEGEPVMWKENDWDRELFNGTLGVIEKAYDSPESEQPDPSEHLSARINFDTGQKDVTVGDLDFLQLAYAITVHKSQGSQFKRVIVPVIKAPLMDKSLLYTAVTRGIEQVVLVGDIGAARDAVKSGASADKRTVGLGHLLKLAIGETG